MGFLVENGNYNRTTTSLVLLLLMAVWVAAAGPPVLPTLTLPVTTKRTLCALQRTRQAFIPTKASSGRKMTNFYYYS